MTDTNRLHQIVSRGLTLSRIAVLEDRMRQLSEEFADRLNKR